MDWKGLIMKALNCRGETSYKCAMYVWEYLPTFPHDLADVAEETGVYAPVIPLSHQGSGPDLTSLIDVAGRCWEIILTCDSTDDGQEPIVDADYPFQQWMELGNKDEARQWAEYYLRLIDKTLQSWAEVCELPPWIKRAAEDIHKWVNTL